MLCLKLCYALCYAMPYVMLCLMLCLMLRRMLLLALHLVYVPMPDVTVLTVSVQMYPCRCIRADVSVQMYPCWMYPYVSSRSLPRMFSPIICTYVPFAYAFASLQKALVHSMTLMTLSRSRESVLVGMDGCGNEAAAGNEDGGTVLVHRNDGRTP